MLKDGEGMMGDVVCLAFAGRCRYKTSRRGAQGEWFCMAPWRLLRENRLEGGGLYSSSSRWRSGCLTPVGVVVRSFLEEMAAIKGYSRDLFATRTYKKALITAETVLY